MKKFVLMIVATMLACLAVTSCKGVKPEFKFQLEFTGDVADVPTCIKGDFAVNATNEVVNDFAACYVAEDAAVLSIADPQGVKANGWLDEYVQDNVISQLTATTTYYIAVRGYVHETATGITFSVDKVFTNR